jgi:hypothetical protein
MGGGMGKGRQWIEIGSAKNLKRLENRGKRPFSGRSSAPIPDLFFFIEGGIQSQ